MLHMIRIRKPSRNSIICFVVSRILEIGDVILYWFSNRCLRPLN